MKKFLTLFLCLTISAVTYSAHLKGGWVYYESLGDGATAGTTKYRITVKQYLECNSNNMQIDQEVFLGIYDGATNQLLPSLNGQGLTINRTGFEIISKSSFNPCISPAPVICYRIDSYETTMDLPTNNAGYTLAVQRCCRIAGIINVSNSSNIGITYTTTIPGTINGTSFQRNSSAIFAQKDTVVVCYNGNFTFDFSATDADKDSLTYSFCNGLIGGGSGNTGTGPNSARPNPPANPPYVLTPYNSGYTGSSPMGSSVVINNLTGLISGTAPGITGQYIVAVCASEFRNGIMIGTTRKEIHITVANCSLAGAQLQPTYTTCDGFTMSFQNESTSPLISSYAWSFGDPASGINNSSTSPTPSHTYTDSGVFVLKLKVASSGGCNDSTTALVRVYPGFVPDFSIAGSCFQTPFQFTDRTTTRYGVVDSWRWDFGETTVADDTSRIRNPSYQYPTPGNRSVRMIVTNSKGCIDTITKTVVANNLPSLNLPFKDTLICSIDTLPLVANGNGFYTWSPSYNIINPNSPTPLVYPKRTTTYLVTLNESGCIKTDSIKVNVLDFITVDAGADTSICRTDSIVLKPTSAALQYLWTPSTGLNNPNIKTPVARPLSSTKYFVTANLGKCQDRDSLSVVVTPYPQAYAGTDTSICFSDFSQLNGTVTGSSFTWTPANTLQNVNTLSPVARPTFTTSYILVAYDTIGCPKPARDTVIVNVNPRILAFAGNDTTIVANQPLQLNATGGTVYAWSPSSGLSNPAIANPVVVLGTSTDSITYRVRVSVPIGCAAFDDITVRVFKTGPDILVPSAFTPNRDGRNDILKPILIGMKGLNYFRVYNRWGKMVFNTAENGKGWDGRFGGIDQGSGTFVYTAEGDDYLGKRIFRKGTVVLIR